MAAELERDVNDIAASIHELSRALNPERVDRIMSALERMADSLSSISVLFDELAEVVKGDGED